MPDRPARRRPRAQWPSGTTSALSLALVVACVALMTPGRALGAAGGADGIGANPGGAAVANLAPPRETCAPNETRLAGGFNVCAGPAAGGGFDLGGLSIFIGIIAVGGVILLFAAAVILRRTSAPTVPADPGEWWTCRNCGKTNVLGSARCYACGAWHP